MLSSCWCPKTTSSFVLVLIYQDMFSSLSVGQGMYDWASRGSSASRLEGSYCQLHSNFSLELFPGVILGGFPLLCVHVYICTHTCMHKSSVCVCVCPCVTCTYMKCSDSARCFPPLLCTLFSETGVSPELPPAIEGYECALCMWVSGSKVACLCLYSFSAELSPHPEVPLLGAPISTFLLSYLKVSDGDLFLHRFPLFFCFYPCL